MFKRKLKFRVEDMDAINFCRILGKYGLKFELGKRRTIALEGENDKKFCYRVFMVYASRRKAYKLYEELNRNREPEL